ncbi:MAG: polysaccharide deacetylase family protein [Eubacteriales bacterium]|nr:polysaccharide deacetylase family protein [Eubacteriales bacterium]
MKKTLLFILLLLCIFFTAVAEKYEQVPAVFAMQVQTEERKQNNNESFVYKEYLITSNAQVNTAIAERVDAFDSLYASQLQADPKKQGHKNSRLEIGVVYYRTGEHYVSTLVFARQMFQKQVVGFDFNTVLYNLKTGQSVALSEILAEDSQADFLLQVQKQISALYPNQGVNAEALQSFVQNVDALPFTMSAMELTIHLPEKELFAGKNAIAHARFYYPQLSFSDTGINIADNGKWKFVALSFDDGPKDPQSFSTLQAMRKVGGRMNYFFVGKQMEPFGYVLPIQMSENHLLGNHTMQHWSGYSMKTFERRRKELTDVDAITLELVGEKARYFRAPGGTYPPWAEADIGLPIIQWSVDTYDYTGKPRKRIFYSVRDNVKDGDIVLMHDTGFQTHLAIPLIGEWLTQNGYYMVTLDELAAAYGVQPLANEVYWSFREGEDRSTKQE